MEAPKEYPILFSSPMIIGLLAGRKRVTRRLSKRWLKIKSGDLLWCREGMVRPDGDPWLYRADNQPVMVAQEDETAMIVWAHHKQQDYCPSIHMPRWASRITLEATEDAREEPLSAITEAEAIAEGCLEHKITDAEVDEIDSATEGGQFARLLCGGTFTAKLDFMMLWNELHTKPGERWSDDPTVVRLAFRRLP